MCVCTYIRIYILYILTYVHMDISIYIHVAYNYIKISLFKNQSSKPPQKNNKKNRSSTCILAKSSHHFMSSFFPPMARFGLWNLKWIDSTNWRHQWPVPLSQSRWTAPAGMEKMCLEMFWISFASLYTLGMGPNLWYLLKETLRVSPCDGHVDWQFVAPAIPPAVDRDRIFFVWTARMLQISRARIGKQLLRSSDLSICQDLIRSILAKSPSPLHFCSNFRRDGKNPPGIDSWILTDNHPDANGLKKPYFGKKSLGSIGSTQQLPVACRH